MRKPALGGPLRNSSLVYEPTPMSINVRAVAAAAADVIAIVLVWMFWPLLYKPAQVLAPVLPAVACVKYAAPEHSAKFCCSLSSPVAANVVAGIVIPHALDPSVYWLMKMMTSSSSADVVTASESAVAPVTDVLPTS